MKLSVPQTQLVSLELYIRKQNTLLFHIFLKRLDGFILYVAFCNLFFLPLLLGFHIYVVTGRSGSFVLIDA